jgi:hypothetical protein
MRILMIIVRAIGVVFSLLSAWLWLESARIETPTSFHIVVTAPVVHTPVDQDLVGTGHSPSLTHLGEQLVKQSQLSAKAAEAMAAGVFLMEIVPNLLTLLVRSERRATCAP